MPRVRIDGEKRKRPRLMRGLGMTVLAPEPEALDHFLILRRLGGLQVVEKLATLVHQLDETATGSVVALVRAEVLAEAVDALGKQRDLDFGRTSVIRRTLELGNDTGFFFSGKRHQI